MSIATRKGDDGSTHLMFGRRVKKNHLRIVACGTCDELSAALGLARATLGTLTSRLPQQLCRELLHIQHQLIGLMGEVGTLPSGRARYLQRGYLHLKSTDLHQLDQWVQKHESVLPRFKDWVLPGENEPSATLDFARAVCRRAERSVFALGPTFRKTSPFAIPYLNRLGDLLWLMARRNEVHTRAKRKKS